MALEAPGFAKLLSSSLLGEAPYAVVIWDTEFRFVAINRSGAEMNGLSIEQHIGRSIEEVIPDNARFIRQSCERVRVSRLPMFAERNRGRTPAAPHERTWDVDFYPLIEDEEVVGYGCIAVEVTERLDALRALDEQGHQIYEDVVQKLTAAKLALEVGEDLEAVNEHISNALQSARSIIAAQMSEDLVRSTALGDVDLITPPAPVPARPLRVLICDDEPVLRMLYTTLLGQDEAFDVVGEASNGLEVLEAASLLQPDLVLLDLNMPVMDGFEALPKLREVVPNAAVVVLSAFDAEAAGPKVQSRGATGYIEKGTAAQSIVGRLREISGVSSGISVR